MNPSIKRASEVIGLLVIVLLLTVGARYAHSQTARITVSQAGAAAPGPHPAAMDPCAGMSGDMHGQMFMHRPPGMPGQMGMGPMAMPGGMGMPGMEMGGMGPGMGMMPMMPPPMMMRLIARNPKLAGKMMQMHADMMRAIADVLTKYGKEMESGQWPASQKSGEGD
jgi:hypothetical protein